MPVNPEKHWHRCPHGTHGGYTNWECRCKLCRAAHAAYMKARRARMAVNRLTVSPSVATLSSHGWRPKQPRLGRPTGPSSLLVRR